MLAVNSESDIDSPRTHLIEGERDREGEKQTHTQRGWGRGRRGRQGEKKKIFNTCITVHGLKR